MPHTCSLAHRVVVSCVAAAAFLFAACGDRTPTAPDLPLVTNATFAVEGIVREAAPDRTTGRPVGGVRVEVITKRGRYATAVTAADGSYRLEGLAGSFEMRTVHFGYQPSVTRVTNLNSARSVDFALMPIVQTISGFVVDAPPGRNRALEGARVMVTAGPDAGAATVSDGRGRYSLQLKPGEVEMRVELGGYGVTTVRLLLDGAFGSSHQVDISMAPAPDVVRSFVSRASTFAIPVQVRSRGELAIVDFSAYGFEEGDGQTVQVWEDGRLLAQTFVERSFPANTVVLRAPIAPGKAYEVRVAAPGSWDRISVRHPS